MRRRHRSARIAGAGSGSARVHHVSVGQETVLVLLEACVRHILALSRTAVVVRHWFEIDLDDASMEHGVRIELRELAAQQHRGSESAAQLIAADRPLWRAGLFYRPTAVPGSVGGAPHHPEIFGHEPCPPTLDS